MPGETPEPVPNDGRECPKRRPVKANLGGPPVPKDGTHIIYQVGSAAEAAAGPSKARAAAVDREWPSPLPKLVSTTPIVPELQVGDCELVARPAR